jgi:uncharacterized protein YqgC (DUF456 family)
MTVLLLAAIALIGLVMIPFGLPGTMVILAAAIGYYFLVPGGMSLFTLICLGALFLLGEALEWILTARFTKKYGGSRRAGWGAILGGMIGAFVGVPIPIIGSVIGAFVGAFIGAFALEYTRHGEHGTATRVAWGAMIGRAAASAMKVGIGIGMAAWLVFAAIA